MTDAPERAIGCSSIYTLPSQPSRKRAYVWRELKKLGAVYLRDGVATLPRRPDLEQHLREIVRRIEEYEGTVDLILSPRFATEREGSLVVRFQEERVAEFREVYHASVLLRDVLHGVDSDEFGFPDVSNLESELGRLHRWYEQIGTATTSRRRSRAASKRSWRSATRRSSDSPARRRTASKHLSARRRTYSSAWAERPVRSPYPKTTSVTRCSDRKVIQSHLGRGTNSLRRVLMLHW